MSRKSTRRPFTSAIHTSGFLSARLRSVHCGSNDSIPSAFSMVRDLRLRYSVAVTVGGFQLREIARDALVDALKAPLHLGLSEILVSRVDRLELRSVNGHACHAQQIELAAQHDELAAHLANGRAVVLAEVGNGLEIGCELPGSARSPRCCAGTLAPAAGSTARGGGSRRCRA